MGKLPLIFCTIITGEIQGDWYFIRMGCYGDFPKFQGFYFKKIA
jgi:hypothetical protein